MAENNRFQIVLVSLIIVVSFALGWLGSGITGYFSYDDSNATIKENITMPKDRVHEDKIKVYEDRIVINIPGAEWARFKDTHSMEPLFGSGANAIEIVPKNVDEIRIGDIISYNSKYGTIIHRVVRKGIDEEGVYFITKGDNNREEDSEKVRFSEIERVLIGIIY